MICRFLDPLRSAAVGPFAVLVLTFMAGCAEDEPPGPTPYDVQITGFPTMPVPADNPTTVEGIALGRRLFHDTLLSSDQTISCASCHLQEFAFSDPRRVSEGVGGALGTVNAPSLVNVGWNPANFWDGRTTTLEEQALDPVPAPNEMNLPWDQAEARLRSHAEYPQLFERAFGSAGIDRFRVVKAIAQFERTIVSRNARWDKIERFELNPTADEIQGRFKFDSEEGGDCFHCHGHPTLYTPLVGGGVADVFEDNGLDLEPDEGRMAVTGLESDRGKFKVPTLRNIALTAPYMHDGRFATLEEVIDHYSEGFVDSPNLNTKLRSRLTSGSRTMSEDTKRQILAFLRALTDPELVDNANLDAP